MPITKKYFQPVEARSDDKRLAYVLESSPNFGSILLAGVALRVGDAVTLDVTTSFPHSLSIDILLIQSPIHKR